MKKNQFTAGTYFLGAGLTDVLTLGTSPWMLFGYNLDNLILRFKINLTENQNLGHQVAYFKSNPKLGTKYDQTSMSYWLTHSISFNRYTLNTTINYMYFWEELRPFSLRREPFNNQAQQFTLTTLHQFYFTDQTILQFELGILGINYKYPNLSAGASVVSLFENGWSFQIGGSISKRFSGPQYPDDQDIYFQKYIQYGNYQVIDPRENYLYDSIHPEIQIQYWF